MERYCAAFALPYLEALGGEPIFPMLVQVIAKVSGATDETGQRA